jgi:thioredoxin 2
VKVNADESPAVSGRFEVQAIPTLVLLNRGKVIDKQVGAAPIAHLRTWVTSKLDSKA